MKYIPFTEEELDEIEKTTKICKSFLSSDPKDFRIQLNMQSADSNDLVPICNIVMLIRYRTLVIEKFDLVPAKKRFEPKYREMFLELAVRYLLAMARVKNLQEVDFYGSDPMLPNILIDRNFKLVMVSDFTQEFKGILKM